MLTRIFNVAVKQKRLTVIPCSMVEFPVSVKKATRKPHYMTATQYDPKPAVCRLAEEAATAARP